MQKVRVLVGKWRAKWFSMCHDTTGRAQYSSAVSMMLVIRAKAESKSLVGRLGG